MDKNLLYILALDLFPKFGPASLRKILTFFPDAESAFNSSLKGYISAGISENTASEFIGARSKISPENIFESLEREKIKIALASDKNYPGLLKEIYEPPFLLYYRGELKIKENLSLAIVGSRKFSPYGQQVAEKISYELAGRGCTIVSGLALGIDTISHNAALAAGGRTIAILGTGIDAKSIYPPSNRSLAEKIVESGGMVASEFPLGTAPLRYNFPRRNRVISGLSLATLVVEAGERSGALITADFALEQNREVFAVPGNIFSPVSKGPNNLIRAGARPVTQVSDILDVLDLSNTNSYIEAKTALPETGEEKIILGALNHEPTHVDDLSRLTKLSTSVINSTLILMEMKGMVRNVGGMMYVLNF